MYMRPSRYRVIVGSDKGLVLLGIKPLPEPSVTY